MSRDELLDEVWGYDSSNTRTVDVHVAWLRQKLSDKNHEYFVTVHGRGYRFDAP